MGDFIKVNTEGLGASGTSISGLAADYKEKIAYIYSKINELSTTAFVGEEMKTYSAKMEDYRPIMDKLGNIIDDFGIFMTKAANTYSNVQEQAKNIANNL